VDWILAFYGKLFSIKLNSRIFFKNILEETLSGPLLFVY